jgi:acyl phosphate:glycerol-3-phosphate acyltransferase
MSAISIRLSLVGLAYLLGSIPFGYLCARLVKGIDIRQHGSGNIGATNVGRVLGSRWGLLVLVLDGIKGFLPVAGLSIWLIDAGDIDRIHWQVAAGVATILGHMFPCWLGFRGGKGVATSLGVVVCLGGWSTIVAAGVFLVTFAIWRFASLASITASIAFAAAQLIRLQPTPFSATNWSLAAFSVVIPVLIVFRHRANIGRMLRGEERPYSTRADGSDTGRNG